MQEAWTKSEENKLILNLQLVAIENIGVNFNFLFSNGFRTEQKMVGSSIIKNSFDTKTGKAQIYNLPETKQVRKVQIYYHSGDYSLWGLKFFDSQDGVKPIF